MNEREALKLALEALESTGLMWPHIETAITAIREALAQPDYRAMYLKVRDELAELQQRSEK